MARPKKDQSEKCTRQNISMEPEQLKRVTQYCQQQERSISWVVRKALDNYLDKVV
ncbi:MAG: ribbon-helix-helix protein, CopG family [Lachnospiraceae bacterium]